MQPKVAMCLCAVVWTPMCATTDGCEQPCEVEYPIVRGGDYTEVRAFTEVTVVSSASGLDVGETYLGEVLLHSNQLSGLQVSFSYLSNHYSPACVNYKSNFEYLPLDGSVVSLECDAIAIHGTLDMHFVEDPLEDLNPAIGIPGRIVGEVQSEGEVYAIVFRDFFDEFDPCYNWGD